MKIRKKYIKLSYDVDDYLMEKDYKDNKYDDDYDEAINVYILVVNIIYIFQVIETELKTNYTEEIIKIKL